MSNKAETPTEYKLNDHVVYRRDGICEIVDIREEDFGGMGIKKYYILQPVYSPNTQLYIPLDSPELTGRIRRVLTKEEIDSLILLAESHDDSWVEDSGERYEMFKGILNSGSRSDILRVLKQLSLHKEEVAKINRKFYANDEKMLGDAERIITDEFAFVLGIDKKDVIPYILRVTEGAE